MMIDSACKFETGTNVENLCVCVNKDVSSTTRKTWWREKREKASYGNVMMIIGLCLRIDHTAFMWHSKIWLRIKSSCSWSNPTNILWKSEFISGLKFLCTRSRKHSSKGKHAIITEMCNHTLRSLWFLVVMCLFELVMGHPFLIL